MSSQAAYKSQAVLAGKSDIDHRKVKALGGKRRRGKLRARRAIHREACNSKPALDRIGDQVIVLDHQDTHTGTCHRAKARILRFASLRADDQSRFHPFAQKPGGMRGRRLFAAACAQGHAQLPEACTRVYGVERLCFLCRQGAKENLQFPAP